MAQLFPWFPSKNRIRRRGTINDAFMLSVVSLCFTIAAVVVGLTVSIFTASAATLGYALENLVDTFSSILVVWRFWGGGKTVPEEILRSREKRASIAIATTFILLAICVVSVASVNLDKKKEPTDEALLLALAVPSILIFGVLGVLKLWMGATWNLDSSSLRKDGYCSVCGAVISFGVLIGAALELSGNGVWWLDSTVAIIIALGLSIVGLKSLVHNAAIGNKFWTYEFWVISPSKPLSSIEIVEGQAFSETSNALVTEKGEKNNDL